MPRTLSQQHQWVGATLIDLDDRQASRGSKRGTVRVPSETKIEVLDVYCHMCRKSYEDAADTMCPAAESNEYLRGGPIGERAKRKHPDHDCERYGCTQGVNPQQELARRFHDLAV